jgi:hypothetical protein
MGSEESRPGRGAYKQFHATVRIIFNDVDPKGLIRDGAPSDEYESEVSSLLPMLKRCRSEADVDRAIAKVLADSFNETEPGMRALKPMTQKVYLAMIDAEWNEG